MTYDLIVKQLARSLRNLDTVLEKTTKHAEARKFDVNNFISARLYPDMLPFVAQVRIAEAVARVLDRLVVFGRVGKGHGHPLPRAQVGGPLCPQCRRRLAAGQVSPGGAPARPRLLSTHLCVTIALSGRLPIFPFLPRSLPGCVDC